MDTLRIISLERISVLVGSEFNSQQAHGAFTEKVVLKNGVVFQHRCSFSTGMSYSMHKEQYARLLRSPVPNWIAAFSPTNRTRLIKYCMKHRVIIPNDVPHEVLMSWLRKLNTDFEIKD